MNTHHPLTLYPREMEGVMREREKKRARGLSRGAPARVARENLCAQRSEKVVLVAQVCRAAFATPRYFLLPHLALSSSIFITYTGREEGGENFIYFSN
jgi:hypothetical protein